MAVGPGPALVVCLGLLFFLPLLLQPTALLYSDYSDFLTWHVPYRRFLVRSWQETGELPLWCPYLFAGMPFLHDVQVSAFYPPHWPLYLMPVEHLGSAMSWLVVLHVIGAGLAMLAYARRQGLHGTGALVAALGYMFFGKWLMHILTGGHYVLVPLAWLPLVLLFLEQGIMRRSLWRATVAGVLFALIVLATHPQVTLYCGLFVAAWTLGPVVMDWPAEKGPRLKLVGAWLGLGMWTALVAILLCAVQLLPALEMMRESSRALGAAPSLETLRAHALRTLVGLVGPPLTWEVTWQWEDRAGLGIIWLTLAVCGVVLVGGRRVKFEAWVSVVWLVLGLGAVAVVQWLPGFDLWRLPSRMLLLLGLPMALLAGRAVQVLSSEPVTETQRGSCRIVLVGVVVAVLVVLGMYAQMVFSQRGELRLSPYWLSLAATLPATWWLLGKAPTSRQESWATLPAAWLGVVLIDLWAIAWPLVAVHSEEDTFAPSASLTFLQQQAGERGRVLDINPIYPDSPQKSTAACATPLWPNIMLVGGIEGVRGYDPVDVRRFKEYVQFVFDGDKPLGAMEVLTLPGLPGFPIENQSLANLLGVRYLVLPRDMPLERVVKAPEARPAWKAVFDDPNPRAYCFVPSQSAGRDAGFKPLPPYTIYENQQVLPRAWVVPEARPLPERGRVLAELKTTDFSRCVLLEDFEGQQGRAGKSSSSAVIREYRPNCVTIDAATEHSGWLVLADVWYPGWTCTVDGEPSRIHRANFLFRAVELPPGSHRVVFTLAPRSYQLGKLVSGTAACLLVGSLLILGLDSLRRRRGKAISAASAEGPVGNIHETSGEV
jgi:hypothetical protein